MATRKAKRLLLVVRTQEALNRAEEENILRARIWAARSRLVRGDLLSDRTLRRIHKEMFGGVWRWAGVYRLSASAASAQFPPKTAEALMATSGWSPPWPIAQTKSTRSSGSGRASCSLRNDSISKPSTVGSPGFRAAGGRPAGEPDERSVRLASACWIGPRLGWITSIPAGQDPSRRAPNPVGPDR